jgi:hypothetical protein
MCVRRNPAMSAAEFQEYWRDVHGSMVAASKDTLGIHSYVQHHAILGTLTDRFTESRGALEPFDGVAQVFFQDVPTMLAAAGTDSALEASRRLIADEGAFIDLSRSSIFLAQQYEVVPST